MADLHTFTNISKQRIPFQNRKYRVFLQVCWIKPYMFLISLQWGNELFPASQTFIAEKSLTLYTGRHTHQINRILLIVSMNVLGYFQLREKKSPVWESLSEWRCQNSTIQAWHTRVSSKQPIFQIVLAGESQVSAGTTRPAAWTWTVFRYHIVLFIYTAAVCFRMSAVRNAWLLVWGHKLTKTLVQPWSW